MQRDNQMHSHSVYTCQRIPFPLLFKQSYVKLLLLNSISVSFRMNLYQTSYSLVQLSFLAGAVLFPKPSQIKVYFQKSVNYFGNGIKSFPFPVKVLLSFFNWLHVSRSKQALLRSVPFSLLILAHLLSCD